MHFETLDRSRIHIWRTCLASTGSTHPSWRTILSNDEREKADRLPSRTIRSRFVSARTFLRNILAGYLRVDPASLAFFYGAFGKPFLEDAREIEFNLSHSGDVAILAVAYRREVGIDIESISSQPDLDGIARQAFSRAECEALARMPLDQRRNAFFRIWTRKEAYIKARGVGLSYPTSAFSVSDIPENEDALIADDQDRVANDAWRVMDVPAPVGFAAALAASGRDWSTETMTMRS